MILAFSLFPLGLLQFELGFRQFLTSVHVYICCALGVYTLFVRLHLPCTSTSSCTPTSAVHVYSPVSSSNTIPSHTVEPVGLRSHRGQPTSSHTVEPVGLRSHRGQPTSVDREVSQPDAGTSSCTSTPAMAISAALRNTLNQGRPPTRPYSCHWRWHE